MNFFEMLKDSYDHTVESLAQMTLKLIRQASTAFKESDDFISQFVLKESVVEEKAGKQSKQYEKAGEVDLELKVRKNPNPKD